MTPDYSKSIKRELRALAAIAYERELRSALDNLDSHFSRWRSGKMDSITLHQQIHDYYTGISRELFKQYNYGQDDTNVANAFVRDILRRDEVSASVSEAISNLIDLFEKTSE